MREPQDAQTPGWFLRIVAEILEVEVESVTFDSTFESLDADSLDVVELASVIDDRYGIDIASSALEDLKTVGDFADYMSAAQRDSDSL